MHASTHDDDKYRETVDEEMFLSSGTLKYAQYFLTRNIKLHVEQKTLAQRAPHFSTNLVSSFDPYPHQKPKTEDQKFK
jgi:hypothetical protein